MSELKIFLYPMLNVAYQNQLHLSHLLPRLKLFIPSFYFYCSSYFMGSSGHLGHLDVMPWPFLWQCQLRGRYHEIPKISPGAYIFQRPFLRGLFLEGLIFGGAYLQREICISKSIGLALQLEVNLPLLLCFTLYLRAIFQVQAPGGLIFGGAIERRVFYVTSLGVLYLEGLIHRGAYFQNFMVNR